VFLHAGGGPRPQAAEGAGSADGRSARGAGVGQAPVALPGSGLPGGARGSEEVDDIAPRAALTDRHGGEHPPGSRCVAGDDEPADRRLLRLTRVRGGHRCVRSQLGAVGSAVVGVASEAPRPALACLYGTAPRSWPHPGAAPDVLPAARRSRSRRRYHPTRHPASSGAHLGACSAILRPSTVEDRGGSWSGSRSGSPTITRRSLASTNCRRVIEGFLVWNQGHSSRGRRGRGAACVDRPPAPSRVDTQDILRGPRPVGMGATTGPAPCPSQRPATPPRSVPSASSPDGDRDLMPAVDQLDDPAARCAIKFLGRTVCASANGSISNSTESSTTPTTAPGAECLSASSTTSGPCRSTSPPSTPSTTGSAVGPMPATDPPAGFPRCGIQDRVEVEHTPRRATSCARAAVGILKRAAAGRKAVRPTRQRSAHDGCRQCGGNQHHVGLCMPGLVQVCCCPAVRAQGRPPI
jgi:hypothetical protein